MTDATEAWDHECDVLVVGSGNAGLVAALAARHFGLDVLVIEKADRYGGSSALSGGGVWVPNNPVNVRAGVRDTREKARQYLKAIIGDRVPEGRIDAYLDYGPEMIQFLEEHTHARYMRVPGYSDYHPEEPGGDPQGRTMEPVPFDTRKLGDDADGLNRQDVMKPPGGLCITTVDYRQLTQIMRTWTGRLGAARVGARTVVSKVTGRRLVSLGAAGVARLRLSLREAGIPLWLSTPLDELIVRDDAVVGVRATRDGASITIRAKRAVVLASGGFEHNDEMRRKYQSEPITTKWTSGAKSNTGDGINAGLAVGGTVDLMDDAWWGPTVMMGPVPFFLLAERSLPGAIVVNGAGQRYVNEAAPYVNFVHSMYEGQETGVDHIPSYLIFDQRYRNRYPFSIVPPRRPIPQKWIDAGIVKVGATLDDLAGKIGVPADTLRSTVDRYNSLVEGGRDLDFGKGDSAYDRYYGDPSISPNPCLAPVDRGPFYAAALWPGDLGTKGGLVCDERSRVLRADGSPIPGLYASGNVTASVMGNEYPGPGGTLGPAMTFGYIAAKDIAGKL